MCVEAMASTQKLKSQVMNAIDKPWSNAHYAWCVVSVLILVYILAMVDRIIVGLLAVSIQADLNLTDTQIGLLQGFAFAIFYTTLGLPIGWLADRRNRRNLLVLGLVIWSVMTIFAGLATSFLFLFIARIGVGIGEATLTPTVSSLVADYFPPEKRTKAFSIYQLGLAIGSAIAWLAGGQLLGYIQTLPPITVAFFGVIQPWQLTMIGVGLPGLFVAVLMMLTVKEPIRRDMATNIPASWKTALRFIRVNRGAFLSHHVGMSLAVLGLYAWLAWLPTFFVREFEWAIPKSTLWFSLCIGITGILSTFITSYVVSQLSKRGCNGATYIALMIGVAGSAFFGVLVFLMPTPELSLIMLSLCGLFIVFAPACGLAALVEITPNEIRAKCTAIYLMVLGLLAVAEGPLFVALLTDHVFADPQSIGFSVAIVVGGSGAVGLFVLLLGLPHFRSSLQSASTWRS